MNLFKRIIKNAGQHLKMLSLWDIRSNLSGMQKIKIAGTVILNIWNSIAKILAPAALASAVEMIATSKNEEQFGVLTLGPKELLYISVLLTAWVKSEIYFKNFLVKDIENTVTEKNSMKLINLIHSLPIEEHVALRADVIKYLGEVINVQSKLGKEVVTVVYQVLMDTIIGTAILWRSFGPLIGVEFMLYCILDVVLLNQIVELFTSQSKAFERNNKALHKFFNHEYEILNYEETVRMLNHEKLETDLSEGYLQSYLNAMNKYQTSESFASLLKLIPIFIANVIPTSFMIKDNVTINDFDDFVFLLTYVNLFGSNMLSLNNSMKSCFRAMESIDKMRELFERSAQTQPTRMVHFQLKMKRTLLGFDYPPPEISFENVTFTYPQSNSPTLKGLNFKIAPGQKIGIIGHSNAGKSTIIKLLYGMYRPQSGVIKLNGQDISAISKEVLCKIFSCVPQTADLFREKSLKYNVLYGSTQDLMLKKYLDIKAPKEDRAEVQNYQSINEVAIDVAENLSTSSYHKANKIFSDAMKKVQLQNLDNRNADKKRGTQSLSGGQRQRVNLARAIVRNSSIFLIDEGTASLDSFTESEVLKNFKEVTRGKTVLMITHRLSTVKDADEIIVLENGEVVEKGEPSYLLEQQGLYYDYWRSQY